MIDEDRIYTPAEVRMSDRDHALREVLTCTAGLSGLSHRAERDIRKAVMRHVEPILHLADAATAARVEYEAIDRQLDVHVREDHPGCTLDQPCPRVRLLKLRRNRLLKAWDQAYCAILEGRR